MNLVFEFEADPVGGDGGFLRGVFEEEAVFVEGFVGFGELFVEVPEGLGFVAGVFFVGGGGVGRVIEVGVGEPAVFGF